jgi:DNA-binding MarR family transcriptional regulator
MGEERTMSWILDFEMEAAQTAAPTDASSAAPSAERDRLLRRMAESLDRLTRRLGREWGPLTHSQWAMLRRLLDGPVLVGVLAERLDISTAGATRMLDKLEECGYVGRHRQEGDMRQVSACLTKKGETALKEAWQAYLDRLAEMLVPVSDEDLARWLDILNQLAPPKQCGPQ